MLTDFLFCPAKKKEQNQTKQETTKHQTDKTQPKQPWEKTQIHMGIFTFSLRKRIDKQVVLKQCQ